MPEKKTPFRSLQVLYRALLWGQILLVILAIILSVTLIKKIASEQLDRQLQVAAVVISVLAFIIGSQIFKRKLLQARAADISAKKKIDVYRRASLMQWALIVVAVIFCVAAYIITHNYSFMALTSLLLIIFGGLNPFKNKVMLQLGLSPSDVETLYHP